MNFQAQRRLASQVLKAGKTRISFDPDRAEDIDEALTTDDIRALINTGAITKKQKKGISRGRTRKAKAQKLKGRQRGSGRRKGSANARTPKKKAWISKIRAIRDELKKMRESGELTSTNYRRLYLQAKGNLFQSRRHLRENIERMKS